MTLTGKYFQLLRCTKRGPEAQRDHTVRGGGKIGIQTVPLTTEIYPYSNIWSRSDWIVNLSEQTGINGWKFLFIYFLPSLGSNFTPTLLTFLCYLQPSVHSLSYPAAQPSRPCSLLFAHHSRDEYLHPACGRSGAVHSSQEMYVHDFRASRES